MVGRFGNQAGKTSRLGCLFVLFLLAAAVYVGVDAGEVYLRYYRLKDFVNGEAGLAAVLTDDVIRGHLVAYSDTIGADIGPKRWTITRSGSPRTITITSAYEDSVVIQVLGWRKVHYVHFALAGRAGL